MLLSYIHVSLSPFLYLSKKAMKKVSSGEGKKQTKVQLIYCAGTTAFASESPSVKISIPALIL